MKRALLRFPRFPGGQVGWEPCGAAETEDAFYHVALKIS